MEEKEIKSKEEYIDLFADKIWDREILVNSETGRFEDRFTPPTLYALYKGLDRFIEAQDRHNTYQTALEEVKSGKKKSYWIWYIFPQRKGLGHSNNSKFYGLDGVEEAAAYLAHPVLGARLREISEALLTHKGKREIDLIMGSHIDVVKLQSCMNLFNKVSPNDIFKQVLEAFF